MNKKRWLHPFVCPHCRTKVLIEVGQETPTNCPVCHKPIEPVTPIEKKVLEFVSKGGA